MSFHKSSLIEVEGTSILGNKKQKTKKGHFNNRTRFYSKIDIMVRMHVLDMSPMNHMHIELRKTLKQIS
ncbi:hypothetical protein ABH958_005605 [Bacillus sp. RC250]